MDLKNPKHKDGLIDLVAQSDLIIENFSDEIKNFKQVCPKEMLDKLSNPLSLKNKISKAI